MHALGLFGTKIAHFPTHPTELFCCDAKSFLRHGFESWGSKFGMVVLHGSMKKMRTGLFFRVAFRASVTYKVEVAAKKKKCA